MTIRAQTGEGVEPRDDRLPLPEQSDSRPRSGFAGITAADAIGPKATALPVAEQSDMSGLEVDVRYGDEACAHRAMNTRPEQSDSERLVGAFDRLTSGERQLLTCALAGNHPPKLNGLRMPVLRALAKADGLGRRS